MSKSFDETFDYLTMLGLTPAAARQLDPAVLQEEIKRKKKLWTSQAINPLYQQEARANLERAKQFEQVVKNPPALEAYLRFLEQSQSERRQQDEREIGELVALSVAGNRTEITTAQRELIRKAAERRTIPVDVVDAVIKARGLTVKDDVGPAEAGMPYKSPAMDRALLQQMHAFLRVLDKRSFYELLDLPTSTSPAKLVSTAQVLFGRWSKSLPKTSLCTAWEKSLQACMTYLKDEEQKARYDRALFNERLDEFLQRIDLVLAGGKLTRDGQLELARLGAQVFGLSNTIVSQCISRRAASRGMSVAKPVQVTMHLQGQVQCRRCYRWNPAREAACAQCGGALARKCRNPVCGKSLAADSKSCGYCGLAASRGAQYAELLRMIDSLLDAGSTRPALEACQLAGQILASPEVQARVTRAGQIRALVASIRPAAADKQWSRVQRELGELVALAAHVAQPGLPDLEEVVRFQMGLKQRFAQVPRTAPLAAQATACLEFLSQWTDCAEVIQHAHTLTDELERQEEYFPARDLAARLSELQPLNEEFQARTVRLGNKAAQAREAQSRIAEARKAWTRAIDEHRWYAAERALQNLEELRAEEDVAEQAAELRRGLAEVRDEIAEIKSLAATSLTRDAVIERYLAVLRRCRDCREALAALQTAGIDSPAPPANLRVTLSGPRRLISWDAPAEGKQPTGYVVQRTIQRPGAQKGEQPFATIYEGAVTHCTDEDILHNGSVVRYAVHSAFRGRLEVEGHVLHEAVATSAPVSAPPILAWQEVLALRTQPAQMGVELRWHHPSGVRHVTIERWTGTRDERPERPDLLTTNEPGRLRDRDAVAGQVYTYRLLSVYDGPDGDFITPGILVTTRVEPAASEATPAVNGEVGAAHKAVPGAAVGKGDQGPLKRMGIWPPVQN